MANNISQNYFTGKADVDLNTTLGQSEVLFAAGPEV
jgi:hypothetical protein